MLAILAMGAAPRVLMAQSPGKVRRIGFLSADNLANPASQEAKTVFPASLKALGYEEGRNLVIEWRWGEAKEVSLPALAEELVRLKVELIVARTNAPIAAAMRATRVIPIVMLNASFPVEMGFVGSLARPGGNITGTSYSSPEVFEKQLQILKEIAPGAIRLAVLWDSNQSRSQGQGKIIGDSLERAATRLGMKLQYFEVSRPEEVTAAMDRIGASRMDALSYLGSSIFRPHVKEIVAVAIKRKIVSVGTVPTFADRGGLVDYAPDTKGFFDRTASYVDRILKGARPADLPVEQPTKFNLQVNLKTASAIGITIPQSILLRADRVIE